VGAPYDLTAEQPAEVAAPRTAAPHHAAVLRSPLPHTGGPPTQRLRRSAAAVDRQRPPLTMEDGPISGSIATIAPAVYRDLHRSDTGVHAAAPISPQTAERHAYLPVSSRRCSEVPVKYRGRTDLTVHLQLAESVMEPRTFNALISRCPLRNALYSVFIHINALIS